jgi:hypothetical protein
MTEKPDDTAGLVKLAGAMVDAVVEQETQALHLIQAELAALAQGLALPPVVVRPDAEIEASFDNMPI